MKSWRPRSNHLTELFSASTNRSVQAELAGGEDDIPPEILDWLARLRLLYGVPFEYLVADDELLIVTIGTFSRPRACPAERPPLLWTRLRIASMNRSARGSAWSFTALIVCELNVIGLG